MPTVILAYWSYRDELSAQNGVLFKGQRVIIPEKLQPEMLPKVHYADLGQEACGISQKRCAVWQISTSFDQAILRGGLAHLDARSCPFLVRNRQNAPCIQSHQVRV